MQSSFTALSEQRERDGEAQSPVPPSQSFGITDGKPITQADVDRFIDPDVTGADRKLVEQLMGAQPINSRGDLILITQQGRIISNRDALRTAYLSQAPQVTRLQTELAESRVRALTYPPSANTGEGGPFYREYGTLGITAGFAFVTVPCSDELFYQGDTGDAYFGENGWSTGQTEGGLQVTDSPPMTLENPSIQLYGRSTAITSNGGYATVVNPTHYACGSPIFVSYGQLPPPNLGYFFASAGIPTMNPTQYIIPGSTIYSTNVSYVYAPVPGDFSGAGYDSTNTYTPCNQCFMRRMDSIAQKAYNPNSGECFGMCNGYINIRWDQIYMGQLTQYTNTPQGSGFYISDTFKVSGENWFGGVQYFPDRNHVQSSTANLPADSINWDWEGLNLSLNAPIVQARGTFSQLVPYPVPCTLDANGFCAQSTGSTSSGTTTCYVQYYYHGVLEQKAVTKVWKTLTTYDVYHGDYNGGGLVATDTETQTTVPYSSPCTSTFSWSPDEPKTQFNDSTLP